MKCPFVIKRCGKCKRLLVANNSNFSKDKKRIDGLYCNCKECKKKENKKYKKEHKDDIKEYNKKYYEENIDYHRKYWEDNKDRYLQLYRNNKNEKKKDDTQKNNMNPIENKKIIKAKKLKIKKANKNTIKKIKNETENNKLKTQKIRKKKKSKSEYNKKYKQSHPEVEFNQHVKRRMKEDNQGRGITKEQWLEMMKFFDWCCAYSGEYLGDQRTIDHIISLNEGGEHEPWNCVPMLRKYNCSKHSYDFIDWYMKQNFFDIDKLLKIYDWIEYAYNKWK